MLRTSEFWITIATVVGSLLVGFGVVSQDDWNNILWPALVYIIGRLVSKFVKKVF